MTRKIVFTILAFFSVADQAFCDVEESVVRAKGHCDAMVVAANIALFNGAQGTISVVIKDLRVMLKEAEACLRHTLAAINDKDTDRNVQKEGGQAVGHLRAAIQHARSAISEGETGRRHVVIDNTRKAWTRAKEANKYAQEM